MKAKEREVDFQQVADYVDNLDDYEKELVLYDLMDFLQDFLKKNVDELERDLDKDDSSISTKTKLLAYFKATEHLQFAKELEQVLCADLF